MTDVTTYESLYEVLREEKYKQELQQLDKEFYKNVVAYLKEKEKIIESQRGKESAFGEQIKKTQKQLDSVKKMVKEIYERRENKILQRALFASRSGHKEDTSSMLQEEQEFFTSLLNELERYRQGVLNNILLANDPAVEIKREESKTKEIKREESEAKTTTAVRFVHAVPKFIGTDLKIYGPFEPGETAELPEKIAHVLKLKERIEVLHHESEEEEKKVLSVL